MVLLKIEKLDRKNARTSSLNGEELVVVGGDKNKDGGGKQSKSKLTCFYCKEKVHFHNECPKLNEDLSEVHQTHDKEHVNLAISNEYEDDALIVLKEEGP